MTTQVNDLKNTKILIIVESPNKIKTIATILKKAGYKKATVAASVGHILELKDGGPCYNSGIYPEENFKMNLKVASDKTKVVSTLKEQIKAAERVYLMTDGDREGEVISWSLKEFLKIPANKCYRAITHEITQKAVLSAIENPVKLDMDLVYAGQSRMMLDKLIGYGLSPAARRCIGAKSVGRCQSVGLALVVDRENEINSFVPERYYELFLNFTKQNKDFKAKYIGTPENAVDKLKSKQEAETIMASCKSTNQYNIVNITQRIKYESPKAPFCTATFQQEAAQRLGLSVKGAMQCAQKLYEGISIGGEHVGLISYMRTDSTELAKEFLPELKTFIEANFGKDSYNTPKVGKKIGGEQDGHEALRAVSPSMTPDELKKHLSNDLLIKVYRLIWQRTIAAAMPSAEISETVYTIKNGNYQFSMTANELIKPGYRQIYTYEDSIQEDDSLNKVNFVENELLQNTYLDLIEKSTQPKPRYTEASLVKELQKREIGRPSTYATIVETILSASRGYANLEDKKIVPTERGMQLAAFCNRAFPHIINYDYTKQMEESLDQIASGKLNWLDYMNAFYTDLQETLKNNKETSYYQAEEKICPQCGKPMVIRRNRFGKLFYGCSNYPNCHGIENIN